MTEDQIPVIFRAHARILAAKASRKWFRRIPAADLTQVALLAAVLALRSFDPGLGVPVHLWIKRKMEYAMLDAIRDELHLKRQAINPATVPLASRAVERAHIALPDLAATHARLDIVAALRLLNVRQREVIERRFFRDESQAAIAVDLGIHFSRVSQIEKAACLKMRTAFEGSARAIAPSAHKYAAASA